MNKILIVLASFFLLTAFTPWTQAMEVHNAERAAANTANICAAQEIPQQINVLLDQLIIPVTAYISKENRAMLSLDDTAAILGCQVEMADSSQVHIINSSNNYELIFRIDQYSYLQGDTVKQIDTRPVRIADDIYLPLRAVAEGLGYYVYYNTLENAVMLTKTPIEKPDDKQPVPSVPDNLPCWGSLLDTPSLAELLADYEILGGYYTTLLTSHAARTNNIELACQAVDGSCLQPGQTFSFNSTVGIRSSEKGYQEAPVFVDKKVVPGIGGGICQVSSTLYNAALEAEMPVMERYPHSLPVAYVAPGKDATVTWGGADLKFCNNREYPIKIVAKKVGKYVVGAVVHTPQPALVK